MRPDGLGMHARARVLTLRSGKLSCQMLEKSSRALALAHTEAIISKTSIGYEIQEDTAAIE